MTRAEIIDLLNQASDKIQQTMLEDDPPISLAMLQNIGHEINLMKSNYDNKNYNPAYSKYLLDWPVRSDLLDELMDIAYFYKRRSV